MISMCRIHWFFRIFLQKNIFYGLCRMTDFFAAFLSIYLLRKWDFLCILDTENDYMIGTKLSLHRKLMNNRMKEVNSYELRSSNVQSA